MHFENTMYGSCDGKMQPNPRVQSTIGLLCTVADENVQTRSAPCHMIISSARQQQHTAMTLHHTDAGGGVMGPPQTLQVARTQRDQVNGDRSAHRRHVIAVGVRSIQSTYCCSRTATCPRTATRTALPLVLRRDRRCSCAACPFRAGEFRRREEFLNGDRERQKGVCLYLSNGQCGSPKKAGRAMMLGNDRERNKAVTFHPSVTASLSLCVFFFGVCS